MRARSSRSLARQMPRLDSLDFTIATERWFCSSSAMTSGARAMTDRQGGAFSHIQTNSDAGFMLESSGSGSGSGSSSSSIAHLHS